MTNTKNLKTKGVAGKDSIVALVVAASMTMGSTVAYAAVVCGSAGLPAVVPQTTAGLYINFATNTIGTPEAAVPGWDFNPFSAIALSFFTSTGAANTNAILGGGSSATSPTVLGSGATVGPAGTYFAGAAGANPAWRVGVTGQYVGVRFNNEATTTTHYGWVQIDTVGPNGIPATVNAYCWENTPNTAITTGTTPVSLQKFSVD